MYLILYRR